MRNNYYLNHEKRNDSSKWLVSGYILKGEKTQFHDRLDVGGEKKKEVKDDFKISFVQARPELPLIEVKNRFLTEGTGFFDGAMLSRFSQDYL